MSRRFGVAVYASVYERVLPIKTQGLRMGRPTNCRGTVEGQRQPQNFADVVVLLVNDDARWITGRNIRANGGLI